MFKGKEFVFDCVFVGTLIGRGMIVHFEGVYLAESSYKFSFEDCTDTLCCASKDEENVIEEDDFVATFGGTKWIVKRE